MDAQSQSRCFVLESIELLPLYRENNLRYFASFLQNYCNVIRSHLSDVANKILEIGFHET